MGVRTLSPGGSLLRQSRLFSLPKILPEPNAQILKVADSKADWATKQYPLHQSIVSPLASREKGDWGLKRPLPLKTTMSTSTPIIRINQLDTVEHITDFSPATDHSLTLEKFDEMRVVMTVPKSEDYRKSRVGNSDLWAKSVYEENLDHTSCDKGEDADKRWKFSGPWLANLNEGQFISYVQGKVRPRRTEFRELLRKRLAEELTAKQNTEAMESGVPQPPQVQVRDLTPAQFTDFLRTLRNDRVTLYGLISKFLDLAPLGQPIGFAQSSIFLINNKNTNADSPYGKSGPPPIHPAAGISYLRTNSVMENHPVYGPQDRRTPVQARILKPRQGGFGAKLGVGGFVSEVPSGENEFNLRLMRGKYNNGKRALQGIDQIDITTYGGAKAYVEPFTASVNPHGKIIMKVRETSAEAQLVAREGKGQTSIYNESRLKRALPNPQSQSVVEEQRMNQVMEEVLEGESAQDIPEKDVLSSSSSYGLDGPK